jgi:hypothetical protein
MQHVDHFLHHWGNLCFLLTFGALAVGLVALILIEWLVPDSDKYGVLKYIKPVLLLLAAGLPALGAALAGIRAHGDFEGSKQRSQRMVAELSEFLDDYDAAISRRSQLEGTAEILIETARVMSEDLAAWQELYGRKRLTLPA